MRVDKYLEAHIKIKNLSIKDIIGTEIFPKLTACFERQQTEIDLSLSQNKFSKAYDNIKKSE